MKESNSPKWEQPSGDSLNNLFSSNVHQTTRTLPNQTVHWTSHNSKPMFKTCHRQVNTTTERDAPKPTIVICDTPSPAISVITISSDSDEETESVVCKGSKGASEKKVQKTVSGLSTSTSTVATTCASVLPLTPDNHGHHIIKQGSSSFTRTSPTYKTQPKVNCVTLFDSDSDDQLSPSKNLTGCRARVIKPEPQKDSSRASVCQKKRILSQTNAYSQQCQLSNGVMVQTKQEIITDDDQATAAFLQSLQSMPSTHQQSTPVALTSVTVPSLLSGRYSNSYVKSERSLKSPHCSRDQKMIIVENLEQLSSNDDLARHSQLPSSIRVSPSSHLSQSLYLATSQADIYRDYCRSAVQVSSNLTQPNYISSQSQKYILTNGEHSSTTSFPSAQLPVPPPAHHHTSRTAIATSIPYSSSSSHPLPAHIQPASVGSSSNMLPAAVPLVSFPSTSTQPPPAALYTYSMNAESPKSGYQRLCQLFNN